MRKMVTPFPVISIPALRTILYITKNYNPVGTGIDASRYFFRLIMSDNFSLLGFCRAFVLWIVVPTALCLVSFNCRSVIQQGIIRPVFLPVISAHGGAYAGPGFSGCQHSGAEPCPIYFLISKKQVGSGEAMHSCRAYLEIVRKFNKILPMNEKERCMSTDFMRKITTIKGVFP